MLVNMIISTSINGVNIVNYLEFVYKQPPLLLSYPKSLIGYPESTDKTGFPLNRLRE